LRHLLAPHCSFVRAFLLSAGKALCVLLDFDDNLVQVSSLKDLSLQIDVKRKKLQQALQPTDDPHQLSDIAAHTAWADEYELRQGVLQANQQHYETPEAADPRALEQRLNGALLTRLTPEEVTRRKLWFTAR
jgi:hypothetical protein